MGIVISDLIRTRGLRAVFQPIVQSRSGKIIGFEGLIRGPAASDIELPSSLELAAKEGMEYELEHAALITCIETFRSMGMQGNLFVNVSAPHFARVLFSDKVQAALAQVVDSSEIVVELTEHQPIGDMRSLKAAVLELRRQGVRLALDDFGTGYSNLQWWVQLLPDFIKLDRFFIADSVTDPVRQEALQLLMCFAEYTGAKLLMEGIESEEELEICQTLDVPLVQGYFIGLPESCPIARIRAGAQ